MNIDVTKTMSAWYSRTGETEYLTKKVHDYVFQQGYLDTHGKSVLKHVKEIADRHDEMLFEAFAGALAERLPHLRMGTKLKEFDKERARLIAAALITSILVDNDSLVLDKRIEPRTINGHKKFYTRKYLVLGGSREKNLLKGIETKPGVVNQRVINGWKLTSEEKSFLRRVGSVPFCVSEACTQELLLKGYSLKVDWNKSKDKNGKTMPEDPIMRRKRYQLYADTILDLQCKSALYLVVKYDDVRRVYYEAATLDGFRPHGKLWETLFIDSAIPFDLTAADERVLKHLIYVTLHGRVSVDDANEKFSLEDLLTAQGADPMQATTEKDFGDYILLNKCYQALKDYKQGNTSKFLFGYDFTNSGLLMSGVSFRSKRMMAAGNIGGADEVVDSHTAFGEGYDLDLCRDDIKSIHMGLMHGSTLKSIADTITQVLAVTNGATKKVTVDQVREFNHKAYGTPVDNITAIADWGTKVIGNEQHVLRWTMPDGFSAASRAHYKSCPVQVYAASAKSKEGYLGCIVVRDMPWLEDKNGFPMYGKEVHLGGHIYEVKQKKRGLYARMTHGIDAYMLRHITEAVLASGRPILLKHDDFIAPPSAHSTIMVAAKGVFTELFRDNLYQQAVDEIIVNSPYDLPLLELELGDADNTVWESENFLMP